MRKPVIIRYAETLDEAYEKGYFQNSVNRYDLLDMIQKKNKDIRFIYGKHGIGLYDTVRSKYVAAVDKVNPIPRWPIMRPSDKKLISGDWEGIIQKLRRDGYEIEEIY